MDYRRSGRGAANRRMTTQNCREMPPVRDLKGSKQTHHPPCNDPVLQRFKAMLHLIYNLMARVVLFGSRSRGKAKAESDYDVAVFLTDLPDVWKERKRLADLRVDFLDEHGVFFDAKPYAVTAWLQPTPLMHEIRKDGIDI